MAGTAVVWKAGSNRPYPGALASPNVRKQIGSITPSKEDVMGPQGLIPGVQL